VVAAAASDTNCCLRRVCEQQCYKTLDERDMDDKASNFLQTLDVAS